MDKMDTFCALILMDSAPKITLCGGEWDGVVLPDMGNHEIICWSRYGTKRLVYIKADDNKTAHYHSLTGQA